MKNRISNHQGFTLIEMLVTLGIFILIVGLAMPLLMRSSTAAHIRKLEVEMGAALEELQRYVAGKEAETQSDDIVSCALGRIQMLQSPYLEDDAELAADLPLVLSNMPEYLAYEVGLETFEGSDRFVISVSYPSNLVDFRGVTPEEIAKNKWPTEGNTSEWVDGNGQTWQAFNNDLYVIPGGSAIYVTQIKVTSYFYDINSTHNHTSVSYTLR